MAFRLYEHGRMLAGWEKEKPTPGWSNKQHGIGVGEKSNWHNAITYAITACPR
jgi:hypothetical protein